MICSIFSQTSESNLGRLVGKRQPNLHAVLTTLISFTTKSSNIFKSSQLSKHAMVSLMLYPHNYPHSSGKHVSIEDETIGDPQQSGTAEGRSTKKTLGRFVTFCLSELSRINVRLERSLPTPSD